MSHPNPIKNDVQINTEGHSPLKGVHNIQNDTVNMEADSLLISPPSGNPSVPPVLWI